MQLHIEEGPRTPQHSREETSPRCRPGGAETHRISTVCVQACREQIPIAVNRMIQKLSPDTRALALEHRTAELSVSIKARDLEGGRLTKANIFESRISSEANTLKTRYVSEGSGFEQRAFTKIAVFKARFHGEASVLEPRVLIEICVPESRFANETYFVKAHLFFKL
ncbi:MAG: hypothetical protein AAGI30_10220 [Planctomycetota bacterium]